jgi:hypothetical protein
VCDRAAADQALSSKPKVIKRRFRLDIESHNNNIDNERTNKQTTMLLYCIGLVSHSTVVGAGLSDAVVRCVARLRRAS